MTIAVWSVKGGVGVSSVAAMLAIGQVEQANDVVLVDLCGAQPVLLGVDDPQPGAGLVDWCALKHPSADALARLEVEARPGLTYLPRGAGQFSPDAEALIETLGRSDRQIIVDCGVVGDHARFARQVVERAATSLAVMRSCFLNLRAMRDCEIVPTGVVTITESGRTLKRADIELVAQAPVVAEFALDVSIARSIDAGLVNARLPRSLVRGLARVVRDAA